MQDGGPFSYTCGFDVWDLVGEEVQPAVKLFYWSRSKSEQEKEELIQWLMSEEMSDKVISMVKAGENLKVVFELCVFGNLKYNWEETI